MKFLLSLLLAYSTFTFAAPKEAILIVKNVTFTNRLVDGKKTWLPATAKFKAGQKVEIKLVNTLSEPHGFSMPGLIEDIIVNSGETKSINFTPKNAGTFPFKCQLHPAHVGGSITIES